MALTALPLALFAAMTVIMIAAIAEAAQPESEIIQLAVNPKKLVALVSERFLSVSLDPMQLRDQGPVAERKRTLAMMHALSPAYLRIAGPSSDSLHFTSTPDPQADSHTITESEVQALFEWARQVNGLELIICLNALVRTGGAWDSRNTLDLLAFADAQGYPISWQFGYDASALERAGVTALQLGAELARTRALLAEFPRYSGALLLGPDVSAKRGAHYLQEAARAVSPDPGAIVWQPWLYNSESHDEDLDLTEREPEREDFNRLLGRGILRKPLWISESDAKPTSRFGAAIQWARRIQVATRLGAEVIFRRPDLRGADRQLDPDFWVSVLHKRLCGRAVLDSSSGGVNVSLVTHCVTPASAPDGSFARGPHYQQGDITLFAVNSGASSSRASVRLNLPAADHPVVLHEYILSSTDIDSRLTLLNGRPLTIDSLPSLTPRVHEIAVSARDVSVELPPHSVAFFLFPGTHARACDFLEAVPSSGANKELGFDNDGHSKYASTLKSKAKAKLAKEGDLLQKKHARRPIEQKVARHESMGSNAYPIRSEFTSDSEDPRLHQYYADGLDSLGRWRRAVPEKQWKFSPEDWAEKFKRPQAWPAIKHLPPASFPEHSEYEGVVPVSPVYRPEEIKTPKPAQVPHHHHHFMKRPLKLPLIKPSHPPHHLHIPPPPKPLRPIPSGGVVVASLIDPVKGTSAEEQTDLANQKQDESPFPEGAVLVEVGESSEERASGDGGVEYVPGDDENGKMNTAAEDQPTRATVKNIPPEDLVLDDLHEGSPADQYYFGPGEYYDYLQKSPPLKHPHQPVTNSEMGEMDLMVEPVEVHEEHQPPPPEPHFEVFEVQAATPPTREQEAEAMSRAKQQVDEFYTAAESKMQDQQRELDPEALIDTEILVKLGKKYLQEHKMTLKQEPSLHKIEAYRSGELLDGDKTAAADDGQNKQHLSGKEVKILGDELALQDLSNMHSTDPDLANDSQRFLPAQDVQELTSGHVRNKRSPAAPPETLTRRPASESLRQRIASLRTETPSIRPLSSTRNFKLPNRAGAGMDLSSTDSRVQQMRDAALQAIEERRESSRRRGEELQRRTEDLRWSENFWRPDELRRPELDLRRPERLRLPSSRVKRSDRTVYATLGSVNSPSALLSEPDRGSEPYVYDVPVPERQSENEQRVIPYSQYSGMSKPKPNVGWSNPSGITYPHRELLYGQTPRHSVYSMSDGEDNVWDGEQLTKIQRNKKAPDGHSFHEAYIVQQRDYENLPMLSDTESYVQALPEQEASMFHGLQESPTLIDTPSIKQKAHKNRYNRLYEPAATGNRVLYKPSKIFPQQPGSNDEISPHQHLYHREYYLSHHDEDYTPEELEHAVQKECDGQGFDCYFRYFLENPEKTISHQERKNSPRDSESQPTSLDNKYSSQNLAYDDKDSSSKYIQGSPFSKVDVDDHVYEHEALPQKESYVHRETIPRAYISSLIPSREDLIATSLSTKDNEKLHFEPKPPTDFVDIQEIPRVSNIHRVYASTDRVHLNGMKPHFNHHVHSAEPPSASEDESTSFSDNASSENYKISGFHHSAERKNQNDEMLDMPHQTASLNKPSSVFSPRMDHSHADYSTYLQQSHRKTEDLLDRLSLVPQRGHGNKDPLGYQVPVPSQTRSDYGYTVPANTKSSTPHHAQSTMDLAEMYPFNNSPMKDEYPGQFGSPSLQREYLNKNPETINNKYMASFQGDEMYFPFNNNPTAGVQYVKPALAVKKHYNYDTNPRTMDDYQAPLLRREYNKPFKNDYLAKHIDVEPFLHNQMYSLQNHPTVEEFVSSLSGIQKYVKASSLHENQRPYMTTTTREGHEQRNPSIFGSYPSMSPHPSLEGKPYQDENSHGTLEKQEYDVPPSGVGEPGEEYISAPEEHYLPPYRPKGSSPAGGEVGASLLPDEGNAYGEEQLELTAPVETPHPQQIAPQTLSRRKRSLFYNPIQDKHDEKIMNLDSNSIIQELAFPREALAKDEMKALEDKLVARQTQNVAPADSANRIISTVNGKKGDVASLVEETSPSKSVKIQRVISSFLEMARALHLLDQESKTKGAPEDIFDMLPWSLYKGINGHNAIGNVSIGIASSYQGNPTYTDMANVDWLQDRGTMELADDVDDDEWSAEMKRMRERRQLRREQEQEHHQGPPIVPSYMTGIVTSMLGKMASAVRYLTNLTKFNSGSSPQ